MLSSSFIPGEIQYLNDKIELKVIKNDRTNYYYTSQKSEL